MTQYLDLLSRILMEGTQRKHSEFQGDIVIGGGGASIDDDIQVFYFMGKPIRVKIVNGESWFCLPDLCNILGLTSKGVRQRLDDEVISNYPIHDSLGRIQSTNFVNEDGLYDTTLESRKKDARKFRKRVTRDVLPSIRKTGGYGVQRNQQLPDFMLRMVLNIGQVPNTHFSVISELFATVYGAFESVGHRLSDKAADGVRLRPDISVGRCFSIWLSKNGYNAEDGRIAYEHKFPEGYKVKAYAYPNKMLGTFRDFVYQEWLPNQAPKYLKGKDDKALEYLPKLLPKTSAA